MFRLATNSSNVLWLGEDHLLQVESVYFNESYRRFAYGDIQALLLRQTPRALATNTTLGVLAVGSGLIAWGVTEAIARDIFIEIGGFWIALLVVNLLRGKTCRCHLQTAAGPHLLPSLSRVRPARRAWQLLTAKIDAAQDALPPVDLARQIGAPAPLEQPLQPRVNEFDY